MNCQSARERVLASERPDRPGPGASAHLQGCPTCRSWLRKVVRLERSVARLPVDAPPPPAALLEALEPAGPVVRPPLALYDRPNKPEGARRKLALAAALAAALVLFALGLGLMAQLRPDQPAPLADYHASREQALHQDTAAHRAHALAGLAGSLVGRATASADHAEAAAGHFEALVLTDLMRQAREVSPGEKAETIQALRSAMRRTASRADEKAAGAGDGRTARALRRMAVSAREADRRLGALLA